VRIGREPHLIADREPLALGELARHEDRRRLLLMRVHSASVTGMTDSRDSRTSGNDANVRSALIAASVTGLGCAALHTSLLSSSEITSHNPPFVTL
jgi:hypothetical protein